MDMSSMGGMDTGGDGPFRATNERLAHGLWYCLAGTVGLLSMSRELQILDSRRRRKAQGRDPTFVYQPRGAFWQTLATTTAIFREMSYLQPVYFTGKFSRYFSPLPVGRWLILISYWVLLLAFLWSDTILQPDSQMYAYKWEKVGFRVAWISIAQIPFIYLLSCKFNPVSVITGISYERFNWLHRWAARTVFLTVIVHWSFFFRGWWLADMVKLEFEMMPMVKYGFGAWSTIGWMILSGFGFFRNLSYEIFVVQHICAAAALLWLLHTHVPQYARYYVWMSVGFVSFDWTARVLWMLVRNFHILDHVRDRTPGYEAQLEALPGNMVKVTILNPGFQWRAGQHAYLTIPRLGPLEMHPFTMANASDEQVQPPTHLSMLIKAHSGFSRRLHDAASRPGANEKAFRAFLSGPWGLPPDLRHYETVVLIACASGATFTFPMLQDLLKRPSCVRNITMHWIVRSEDHLQWFKQGLAAFQELDPDSTPTLRFVVHITGSQNQTNPARRADTTIVTLDASTSQAAELSSEEAYSAHSITSLENEKDNAATLAERRIQKTNPVVPARLRGRPSVESIIRPPVEAAKGETAIVVCGGLSITAQCRTFVAALSDERAVHKGSGAQGIFLFSETYEW